MARNTSLLEIKNESKLEDVTFDLRNCVKTIKYNLAEELQTEMTYTAVEGDQIISPGIDITNGRNTHVAFENFVQFVDTTSAKDTMHDTVGIIHQFPAAENEDSSNTAALTSSTFPFDDSREEYPIANAYCMQMLTIDSFHDTIDVCKGATEIAINNDLLWIISLSRNISIPMWLGFNCMISTDQSEIQKIDYLSPKNNSPTSYFVVNETLRMAKEIAEKCQNEIIIVTYDLAIAKMAMQIHESDKPKFDNIFINLGAFHMEIALFKAIGKFIDSSGLV